MKSSRKFRQLENIRKRKKVIFRENYFHLRDTVVKHYIPKTFIRVYEVLVVFSGPSFVAFLHQQNYCDQRALCASFGGQTYLSSPVRVSNGYFFQLNIHLKGAFVVPNTGPVM
jgi:hypothetical protein